MALPSRIISRVHLHTHLLKSSTYAREISTGLFVIPAKPLAVQPLAPSVLGTLDLIRDCTDKLRIYNVIHKVRPESQRGVALAIVEDIEKAREAIASRMTPLPVVAATFFEDMPESEVLEYETPEREDELLPIELPTHLIPRQMDDGLTEGDPKDAIQDQDFFTLELLADLKQCPDYNPNTDLEDISNYNAEEINRRLDEFDAVDMKSCNSWTSRTDPEAPFFTREDYAWLKADIDECSKGATPRLYRRLDLPNKTPREVIVSEDYTTMPLSSSSPLAPYLLLHLVPLSRPCGIKYRDQEFGRMFERLAYLTSDEYFRRLSCFKQVEPESSMPEWLVAQEFTHLEFKDVAGWLALKKREAEYWWRKNGWDRVLVEFFRSQQT